MTQLLAIEECSASVHTYVSLRKIRKIGKNRTTGLQTGIIRTCGISAITGGAVFKPLAAVRRTSGLGALSGVEVADAPSGLLKAVFLRGTGVTGAMWPGPAAKIVLSSIVLCSCTTTIRSGSSIDSRSI